ncbi:hypothetical protein F2P56_030288 [Juglans regia]|uniref:RNase H type-1 domain-containing protein n=2 Tax=Juglans regia TaxID=51240 RepID=A0A833WXB1_JUGRE|nr:uncharacterized protein LOC109013722 [Juglans regia]KAF5449887.1 hypothetical protein F2P56_030288 [Juglans regia]
MEQTSESSHNTDVWQHIWKLQVPNALKIFLWRAAKDILPQSIDEAPFSVILEQLFSTLPKEEHQVLAFTFKQLWLRRNKWIFETRFSSPQQVLNLVSTSILDLLMARCPQRQKSNQVQPPLQWSKPPLDSFKVNWDAAIDKTHCRVGIGVVVKDCKGLVTATLRSSRASFPNPLPGEALAALRAVQFCIELGLTNIILEGDSMIVVKAINGREDSWNSSSLICQDIKLLLEQVSPWSVKHVPRQVNVVAHTLAKSSLDLSDESIHVEDYPHCIHNLLG